MMVFLRAFRWGPLRAAAAWLLQWPAVPQQLTAVATADGDLLVSWRYPPGLPPQALQIAVRSADALLWAGVPDPSDRDFSLPLCGAAASHVELTAVYRHLGRVSRRVVRCTVSSAYHPGGDQHAAVVPPA